MVHLLLPHLLNHLTVNRRVIGYSLTLPLTSKRRETVCGDSCPGVTPHGAHHDSKLHQTPLSIWPKKPAVSG